MCGVVGLVGGDRREYDAVLRDMLSSIAYRGPDESGFYFDDAAALAHARLAILDPQNGRQPAVSEDGGVVVVFNGEIFNFMALRRQLEDKGHVIANHSDTAVLPHLYEEYGPEMFTRLNGQFAIAIWDKAQKRLVLARDRFGEKPLFYAQTDKGLCFASEAKAIFKSGLVKPALAPRALQHVFTYWTTVGSESVFRDVYQVTPGSYLVFEDGRVSVRPYWRYAFKAPVPGDARRDASFYADKLEALLIGSVKKRLVADVPVSFYISGGLDSALVTSLAAKMTGEPLQSFSVTFDDAYFDESPYQALLARELGTVHRSVRFSSEKMASVLGEVIWHTEVPLLRSGAFPMYVLAGLVRDNQMKVVLSGEGSDELFGGYDLFREAKIREFCARAPEDPNRTLLYRRVNNFVRGLDGQTSGSLSFFYNNAEASSPFASHQSRWKLGAFSRPFFSPDFRAEMAGDDGETIFRDLLPADFDSWTPVRRAQALEASTLFSGYLLSSQGDRVSMGQGVECRYPFLDYNIAEFAASLPDDMKIRGLNEKYIVKMLAHKYVPEAIYKRKKFPYRAPINIRELMRDDYVCYMLSGSCLKRFGIFSEDAAGRFLAAAAAKDVPNERDCMLFMGFLTTQILYDRFIDQKW